MDYIWIQHYEDDTHLALFGVLMTSTGCEQEKLPEEDTEKEHTAEEMIQGVI